MFTYSKAQGNGALASNRKYGCINVRTAYTPENARPRMAVETIS